VPAEPVSSNEAQHIPLKGFDSTKFQPQFLGQADALQQPSPFYCQDWLNDQTLFINQAKLYGL
jgi:hypothetical protein